MTEEDRKYINAMHKKKKMQADNEWYTLNSLLGNANWAMFYALLGGREAGKSYAVMRYFVKQWKEYKIPFTWLRLTEPSMRKLLANSAEKLVDADIKRDFDLDLTVKGNDVYDHGEKMATVLALSTFYSDKGVALFDNEFNLGYHICLDEMNREQCEKNTFDIVYAFVNQIENLIRSTKENVKIFLIGNTLQEASDIMTCFNFIPEEFGRYYVKKKRLVVDYIKPSKKYLERRKGSVSDLLTPTASTFTNTVEVDMTLVDKRRRMYPQYIIKFTKDKSDWFTVWEHNIMSPYNGEKKRVVAMRRYLDEQFTTESRDTIIAMNDAKAFRFKDLITQKKFHRCLSILKKS